MRLGIAGPVLIEPFRAYMDAGELDRPQLPSGMGGTAVTHLVLALLERGWEIVIFTLDPDVSDELVLRGPRLTIRIGPYRLRHRARDLFRAERRYLSRAIRQESPDLVSAHWTYEFALGAIESGLPSVVTARDATLSCLRWDFSPYRLARAAMSLRVARAAPRMTAVSARVARHFRNFLLHPREITVIPNGLPESLSLAESAASQDSRPRNTHPTFATVLNGWGRLKNGSTALRAFDAVRSSIATAKLLMFGEDYGPGGTANIWARKRGLDGGVGFVGPLGRDDLLSRLSRDIDVLLDPSREESFSNAIAEGMGLGLPIIGGVHSGAVPDTLDWGRAGLLIDVSSARETARAMIRLASDRDLCEKLGSEARQSAIRRFRIKEVATAYEEVFYEMAGRG